MASTSPEAEEMSISWTSIYTVASSNSIKLPGDKILLPQSALEQLLSASTVIVPTSRRPNADFDPFNPYSLAAARAEQSEWQDRKQQLPHPLTFRLVNTNNGNVVYAGIREFSAEEGNIVLSPFLLEALGLTGPAPKANSSSAGASQAIDLTYEGVIDLTKEEPNGPVEAAAESVRITVHAKTLARGTYVRLRPLEAGYNPDDWKSILERHLRESYTTLTKGEILTVRGSQSEEFRFLIDDFLPAGDGICVVDTDLEVDIEALNEEQARETLKQIMAKSQKAPGTAGGSSVGSEMDIWKAVVGQVAEGDYIDYRLPAWDRGQGLDIELTAEVGDVELYVSPESSRHRAKPREDEHVFGEFSNQTTKKISIQPSNIELEGAEALLVSVHVRALEPASSPRKFSLRAQSSPNQPEVGSSENPLSLDHEKDVEMDRPDEEQCKNCQQWVPSRTMMLHENFCLRNNILCSQCQEVFQKKSQAWQDHWHCPHDSEHGDDGKSKERHDELYHKSRQCSNCPYEAANTRDLAVHKTSVCPGKIILCQFCHLEVPQEGDPFDPSPESLISGLTAHELLDGGRTTECHLCAKVIRLRDMNTHLKHHELEKTSRSKPAICRNANCGRTLEGVGKNGELGAGSRMGQGPGNDLGLCSMCFSPLYVSVYDPEGKALKRRVERRYLAQLISGCGKPWCTNAYCKTARAKISPDKTAMTTQAALPLVKPLMDTLRDAAAAMHFCTDEGNQKKRKLAEMLAAENGYEFEWCIAACEAENGKLDAARSWLANWAPKKA